VPHCPRPCVVQPLVDAQQPWAGPDPVEASGPFIVHRSLERLSNEWSNMRPQMVPLIC